jgi:hypothetical protein
MGFRAGLSCRDSRSNKSTSTAADRSDEKRSKSKAADRSVRSTQTNQIQQGYISIEGRKLPKSIVHPSQTATCTQALNKVCCEPPTLAHNYDYQRRLPHHQKADRAIFVTFRKLIRDPFPADARDVILQHCIHDDGKRFTLHAAVVMPDHVHLLLTPLRDEQGWPYEISAILKLIKGSVGKKCKQTAWQLRPSVARRIV